MHPTTTALEELAEQVSSDTARQYLHSRILPQIHLCHNASLTHRRRYYGCTLASIVLGALIPIFSLCSDQGLWVKVVLAALGSGITGLNAFGVLDRSKELWLSYRQIQEQLTSTLCMYLTQVGIFFQGTPLERDALLVSQCEEMICASVTSRLSIHAQRRE